jgi:hypothetical protein
MSDDSTWEGAWEVEFQATTLDELALALVVRDLVHGTSFDIEGEDGGGVLAIDFGAGDELDGETYRMLVSAEATGSWDEELVRDLTERLLDQLVDEAESLLERRIELGVAPVDQVGFEVVAEDDERWDLVIPDWLAPDGAEVPFGFRPIKRASGEPWPTDEQLDAHGRVVVVPFGGSIHLLAIPAPAESLEGPVVAPLPILS